MTNEQITGVPAFEIALIGYWVPFDSANPLEGDEFAEVRAELAGHGLLAPSFPEGTNVLLTASMIDDAGTEDEPDLVFASITVLQHEGKLETKFAEDGSIEPIRQTRRRKFQWPDPEVGEVEMHEVDYTIPHPDYATFVTVTFTTPNLPRIDEMEWIFDTIVGTAEWVEPDEAPAQS